MLCGQILKGQGASSTLQRPRWREEGKKKIKEGKTAFAAGFPGRDSHGTRTYKITQNAEQQCWSSERLKNSVPSRLAAEGTHC